MQVTWTPTNEPAPPVKRIINPIRYGANHQIVGKSDPQNLSYSGAWTPTTGTFADLAAHISRGHPWMPALLDPGKRRYQQHANRADVLALDIDSGMSIEEAKAHPFIAAHCALAIESNSSTPEQPKFRLVFRNPFHLEDYDGQTSQTQTHSQAAAPSDRNRLLLPDRERATTSTGQLYPDGNPDSGNGGGLRSAAADLPGWRIIKACVTYLQSIIGVADPACKDASRFFFGAVGRQAFILDEFKTLPESFVADALNWHQAREREAERQYQEALKRRELLRGDNPQDTYELVRDALSHIPPRQPGSGNYPECLSVLMALYHEFGEHDAIALGEQWSPSMRGTTWDVPRKVASFRRSTPSRPVTIGSLFHLAKQYGFRFPEREHPPLSKTLIKRVKQAQARRQKGQEKTQQWLDRVLANLDTHMDWQGEADTATAIRTARDQVAQRALVRNSLQGDATVGFFPALELAGGGERTLYTLDGQKGTGKSQSAIKSLVDGCKRAMLSAAIFAPTRLLCESLAAVLEVPTIYTDARAPITILCPESAWKLKGRNFSTVICDEANEVLQRLAEGSLGNEPQLCREQFQRILRGATTIALAQDRLSRDSVNTAARLAGLEAAQIQPLRRQRQNSDIAIKLYPDRAVGTAVEGRPQKANTAKFTWVHSLVEALAEGQRVAIPCGSQNATRELDRLLQKRFERHKKGQVFDGKDSFEKAKTEFCQNPDQWLEDNKPDYVIFSPCFNSGVSSTSEYFDVQYEYATPFETAESVSQRGERIRDAIWGNRIKERHVYLSSRGLAAHPDPAIFTADYWSKLLKADALAPLDRTHDIALALGAHAIVDNLKIKELARLETWQELPAMLAYQCLQTYFKREFLQQEWQGNGWEIETIFPLPDEVLKPLRERWRAARESIVSQRARTLARCKHYENIDPDCEETSGPIERTRLEKKKLALKTGKYEGIDDAQWLESWAVAPGNSGINPIRVQALLKLAMEQPEQFQALQVWSASRVIGSAATLKALSPAIPFTDRELDTVALLLQIEGVGAVLSGDLSQWDKDHPLVQDAAEFARIHADEFARLSQHSQRIHGLQFTSELSDVNCFHKLLKLVGLSTKHCCMKRRVHQYRLEITADIAERIAKAMEQYQPIENLSRKAYRADTRDEFCEHLENHFLSRIRALSPEWDAYVQKLTAEVVSATGSASQIGGVDRSTEMLIPPDTPPWLQLSALIRGVKDWADIEKIAGLFPTEVKQRVWDAIGKADREFRQSILRMKPT